MIPQYKQEGIRRRGGGGQQAHGLDGKNHKVRTYKEYHSVCPSSELGLPPTPHPQASVPPPPCFWGEGNTRWRERGWERPNSNEGHTLWYSLYVRTLWEKYNGLALRNQCACYIISYTIRWLFCFKRKSEGNIRGVQGSLKSYGWLVQVGIIQPVVYRTQRKFARV